MKQYEIGSFQNEKLLEMLLVHHFDHNLPDSRGFTPLNYAAAQKNGKLVKVFRQKGISVVGGGQLEWKRREKFVSEWPLEVNYITDSELFLKTAEEIIQQEMGNTKCQVDPIGNNSEPLEVIYGSDDEPYDAYTTKVDLRNGLYGEYLFYRMQLIRNTNRDVYMVYTRWGRIGENGMFQKTPFGNIEEATVEFEKIFKSKTGNEWKERANFQKQKKKYALMKIQKKNVHYKQLLKPFNFKEQLHKSVLPKSVRSLVKSIINVTNFENVMTAYGINTELLPVTKLKKETLLECKNILEKCKDLVNDLDNERKKGLQAKVEVIEELYLKINEVSSEYYELLPQAKYRDFKPPPITNPGIISQQEILLDDLINVELAAKILLAAQSKMNVINPIDYCYKSMAIDLEELKPHSEEYEILKTYVNQSASELSRASFKLKNIFRLQRRGEYEKFVPFKWPFKSLASFPRF